MTQTYTLPATSEDPNPSYIDDSGGDVTYSGNSGTGTAVTGPTLSAAEAEWNAQNGSTSGNTTASGLPTASGVASDAPLPINSFGATPSVAPTYAGYAQQVQPQYVDPNTAYQQEQTAYAQNAAALAPTFSEQASNLQDSSAARGISSSGAAGQLQTQLQGEQAATLASADEPITSQGMGEYQADLLANQQAGINTGEFTSGQQQGVNLYNAGAANSATGLNANYYADVLGANASSYNNFLNTIEGQGYNTGNEAYQTYLNSFSPNAGVENSITGAESAGTTGYNTAYGGAVAGQNAALGAAGAAAGNYFGNIGAGSGSGYTGATPSAGDFVSGMSGWGGGTGSAEGTGEYAGGL